MRIRAWLSGWKDIGNDYRKALRLYRLLSIPHNTYREEIFSRHFDGISLEEMEALDRNERQNGNNP